MHAVGERPLREHGGTLYHTSLSKEAEEQLAKALENKQIAEAIEAQSEDK